MSLRAPMFMEQLSQALQPEQYKRALKLQKERMTLESTETAPRSTSHVASFSVCGGQGSALYVVGIKHDGSLTCTCVDMRASCSRLGYNCVCKHALFVMILVLKQVKPDDLGFFDRGCRLDPESMQRALSICSTLATTVDDELLMYSSARIAASMACLRRSVKPEIQEPLQDPSSPSAD